MRDGDAAAGEGVSVDQNIEKLNDTIVYTQTQFSVYTLFWFYPIQHRNLQ